MASEHTIREVAANLGVSHRTLRFYEQKGLVKPQRGPSPRGTEQRLYSDADVARLRQIREWVGLGFTLDQVHELLRLQDEAPECLRTALLTAAYDRLSQARQEHAALSQQIDQLEAVLRRKAA